MAESTSTPPVRRQTLRSLRSGQGLGRQADRPDPGPTPVTSGPTGDEESFQFSLRSALEAARAQDLRLIVFRMRSCLVGLHKWTEFVPLPDDDYERAIEERLAVIDPSIVFRRTERDVIGFSSRPRSAAEAERLGGSLASGLAIALGDEARRFAVSPRLGVAIIGGPDGRDRTVEEAAAAAIEAVDRTLSQTDFDTPYLVHNDYIRNRSLRQEQTGNELPRALDDKQISLEFQPRVAADDLAHAGLEVFPRWRHPEMGTVPTIEFLRMAERIGRLYELGRTVRGQAIELAQGWVDDDLLGDRRLWFDVAPVELSHPDFPAEIAAIVEDHPDVAIGLEMADSRLIEDPVFVPIFERLQEAGVELALDNVRPSTLSIGRLQRLPVSLVNLDRELVRTLVTSPTNRDLARLICAYAHDRGCPVTACQVETSQELEVARLLDVDLIQGNVVTRPLGADDLTELLLGLDDG